MCIRKYWQNKYLLIHVTEEAQVLSNTHFHTFEMGVSSKFSLFLKRRKCAVV